MIPKKTERNQLTAGNGQKKYFYNNNNIIVIIITTTALILFLTRGINCCVLNPREFLTSVGEVASLECNARPNNEQQGSVSNLKLESEGKDGTLIFHPPVYGAMGIISTEHFVADGYFLSKLDKINLASATILINETQLKHGGRYVCRCTPATVDLSTGSANLVVLADKLSFVPNGGNPRRSGELLDLNCSLPFSGSISSVSVDLTISDANGTQLTAKDNLHLTMEESLHINYSFIANRGKEQSFICEMKVYNQSSSSEKRLLRSMRANYILNSDSWSGREPASKAVVAVGVVVTLMLLLLLLIGVWCIIRHKRSQKNSTTIEPYQYGSGKPPNEHPTEDKKQENEKRTDGEVTVFDNDLYASAPLECKPTTDETTGRIHSSMHRLLITIRQLNRLMIML